MPKRKRRKSKGSGGAIAGILGLGALSLALVAVGIYLQMKASGHTTLNEATLCPENGPVSVTAVLLDTTDPITETTRFDLGNELRERMEAVPAGGLLAVYGLTGKAGELTAMFKRCNPGDASAADDLTQNRGRIQQRWEEGFNEPLSRIMVDVNPPDTASQSPIMAGIQNIKLTLFDSREARNVPTSLIVASDMIENTDAYSQYKAGTAYENFEVSAARDEYRTSLDGVEVTFLAFQRRKPDIDPLALGEFWKRWVDQHRGTFARWVRLEGLN